MGVLPMEEFSTSDTQKTDARELSQVMQYNESSMGETPMILEEAVC
jgi:hypothetical protein